LTFQRAGGSPVHSSAFAKCRRLGLGNARKKCRKTAGSRKRLTVPVFCTKMSIHQYEAGLSRQTKKSRKRMQSTKKIRAERSPGTRAKTKSPIASKRNPTTTA
jgi:hypothetical protein